MYIYVYAYIYKYIYLHICIYIYTYIYIYIYTHIYIANTMQIFKCREVVEFCENDIYIYVYIESTEYMVAKTNRLPYLYRSFSAKELYNYRLFFEKRPAT